MAKDQKLGRNSAIHLVESIGTISDAVPLPAGVILRDESEAVIWGQLTRTRSSRDWRDFDLLIVAKIARTEGDIRRHQLLLDKSGPLMKTERGTPVLNPLVTLIDTLQRQQLAMIRSLSMTQTGSDPRTMNGEGIKQQAFRDLLGDVDSLIPR